MRLVCLILALLATGCANLPPVPDPMIHRPSPAPDFPMPPPISHTSPGPLHGHMS